VCYLATASVLAFGYFSNESTCLWRTLTGLPCPGCGMIHAFLALAQGDVRAACHYNPRSLAVAPILAWTAVRNAKELLA
jgi:hypothetical protein